MVFSSLITELILICFTGKKVLLGNFWTFHREGVQEQYRKAEAAFIKKNPELEECERVQFQKTQDKYHKVLNKVDENVEAAFSRKRGRMRPVVDDSLLSLAHALEVFDESLFKRHKR